MPWSNFAPAARARRPALLLALLASAFRAQAAAPSEDVVLLHGLARTSRSMEPLAERLAAAGYRVHNLRYPSTKLGPEGLVVHLREQIEACCAGATRLHFVTHSLGGILVRAYLAQNRIDSLGRVVMLAPPNHGSELVDVLGDSPLFEYALGPTAAELGTGPGSFPNRLPAPGFELGVIAGTDSVNPLGGAVIPGEDDGTVSVESTRVDGMSDFVTVDASHTFIMRSESAAAQVIEFLRHGRFRHDDPSAGPRGCVDTQMRVSGARGRSYHLDRVRNLQTRGSSGRGGGLG